MYLIINGEKILGTTNHTDIGLPDNYTFYEVPETEHPVNYYVADGEVLRKPEQPGPDYYWDMKENKWEQVKLMPVVSQAESSG